VSHLARGVARSALVSGSAVAEDFAVADAGAATGPTDLAASTAGDNPTDISAAPADTTDSATAAGGAAAGGAAAGGTAAGGAAAGGAAVGVGGAAVDGRAKRCTVLVALTPRTRKAAAPSLRSRPAHTRRYFPRAEMRCTAGAGG
jgi:hypothetical protein